MIGWTAPHKQLAYAGRQPARECGWAWCWKIFIAWQTINLIDSYKLAIIREAFKIVCARARHNLDCDCFRYIHFVWYLIFVMLCMFYQRIYIADSCVHFSCTWYARGFGKKRSQVRRRLGNRSFDANGSLFFCFLHFCVESNKKNINKFRCVFVSSEKASRISSMVTWLSR